MLMMKIIPMSHYNQPDVCQVLFIDSIEANTGFLAPFSIPFLPTPQYDEDTAPTCPVCLEAMDERISSLLTILCQHTFHYYCLSKWGDGRYVLMTQRVYYMLMDI